MYLEIFDENNLILWKSTVFALPNDYFGTI